MTKSTTRSTYSAVGDSISFISSITQHTNAYGDWSSDVCSSDLASVSCPSTPATLPPGSSVTCTATYVIQQADLDAGKVTNTATGSATFGTTTVDRKSVV